MYKIYINGVPIYLNSFTLYHPGDERNLTAVYVNKPVTLLQYIDTLEKKHKLDSIQIFSRDVEKLKNDFFNLFEIHDAGGGIVLNELGEMLVIYRRGHWDLAKGKLDSGESIEEAAVREVMEETGIVSIVQKELVGITMHAFKNRHGKRVLKRSYWYEMRTHKQTTIPQNEEDIEKAEWIIPEKFISECSPMYRNIREIVDLYLSSRKEK